jgi:hypothetical protein
VSAEKERLKTESVPDSPMLERWEEGEKVLIGELRVADPDVEDGVGESVAELGIRGCEPACELLGQREGGRAGRDGEAVGCDVAEVLRSVRGVCDGRGWGLRVQRRVGREDKEHHYSYE